MSKLIKEHIKALLKEGLRQDGRKTTDYRKPLSVEYGISPKSADGSARVILGNTEVVAGVKFELGKPFPDKQDEGTIIVSMELLPLSSPKFESGPPSIDSIELSRVVDRGIRESGAINFKDLCIEKGEKIWMVFVDIYPINADGNLFDAASLAAIAALQDARFPEYDAKAERLNYENRTSKKVNLKDLPIGVTTIKIGDDYLVDPTADEYENLDARLTVATLNDGTICAMQKGGDESLSSKDIVAMTKLSVKKGQELRGKLKK